eukprot:m.373914 g.373914  ORF g.373914 m.373914 type:complete len:519 (+) comp20893_c0_seq3:310-1866(+)
MESAMSPSEIDGYDSNVAVDEVATSGNSGDTSATNGSPSLEDAENISTKNQDQEDVPQNSISTQDSEDAGDDGSDAKRTDSISHDAAEVMSIATGHAIENTAANSAEEDQESLDRAAANVTKPRKSKGKRTIKSSARLNSDSEDDDGSGNEKPAREEKMDKISAKEKLLAEMFAESDSDSDDDEDFVGFNLNEIQPERGSGESAKKRERKQKEGGTKRKPKETAEAASSEPMTDYQAMLQRKKQQNQRKRRKKDNQSLEEDERRKALVDQLKATMARAAEKDLAANKARKPATSKLAVLDVVRAGLKNEAVKEFLIEQGVFREMALWLAPDDRGVLPNIKIRDALIRILINPPFISVDTDDLRATNIGKVLMMLLESKSETQENKKLLTKIIRTWSKRVWAIQDDTSKASREDLQSHYESVAAARRDARHEEEEVQAKALKPGDAGFCMRARVPMPLAREYTRRPQQRVDIGAVEARVDTKRQQFASMERAFREKALRGKTKNHARAINLSGNIGGAK